MTALPIGDWQFWVVTAVAMTAVSFGLWRILRAIRRPKKKETSVSLTIERKKAR